MKVKTYVQYPNSAHSFRFFVEMGVDLKPGEVFEHDGHRFSVDSFPTNHKAKVNSVNIIETEFDATKLIG